MRSIAGSGKSKVSAGQRNSAIQESGIDGNILYSTLLKRKGAMSYRELAQALCLPENAIGILSKILRGKRIGADSERMIGRALGIISPPRNPIRLTVPDDMADAVQAERAKGRSTRDILTRGLGNGNG